ncbi:MAG: MurR/RpiR family transcriptional regulator [Pseudomonadota bacterium]
MTIKDRIDTRFNDLSASERRIAKVISERYPISALGGIEDLARQADVSPPTVTRFVRHLGFARFTDFQRAVRHEVQEAETSPLALMNRYQQYPPQEGLIADLAASVATLDGGSVAQSLALAVEVIAGTRGRVFVTGGRWTSIAAQYFAFQLGTMRGEVHLLAPTASGVMADRLVDLTRRDLLVMFDVRRYQEEMFAIAEVARQRGVRIVLVTDVELSPVCELAEVTLPVPVATVSPLDTLVPAIAAIDAVLERLVEVYGDAASRRIHRLEEVRRKTSGRAEPAAFR